MSYFGLAAIICSALEIPPNMNIEYSEGKLPLHFGTKANYSCDAGCSLNGTSVRVCSTGLGINGTWTEEEPSCECKHVTPCGWDLSL